MNGEGVPKDIAVAKEWFQIAATQGYEPSQTKLQQIELENIAAIKKQQEQEQSTSSTTEEKRTSRWSLSFFNNNKKK